MHVPDIQLLLSALNKVLYWTMNATTRHLALHTVGETATTIAIAQAERGRVCMCLPAEQKVETCLMERRSHRMTVTVLCSH